MITMPRSWTHWFLAAVLAGSILQARAVPAFQYHLIAAPTPTEQPIAFSHKRHSATGLKCAECHTNPDPGNQMTLPSTSKCMACHISIAKDRPEIQKLAGIAKSGQPVPWVRLYSVPGWVFWDHRAHLTAGLKCDACHGDVAQMEVMTKVTNVTTMGGCIDCHRKSNVSTGCAFCHDERN